MVRTPEPVKRYLKAEQIADDALGRAVHRLSIPNREVRHVYATTLRN